MEGGLGSGVEIQGVDLACLGEAGAGRRAVAVEDLGKRANGPAWRARTHLACQDGSKAGKGSRGHGCRAKANLACPGEGGGGSEAGTGSRGHGCRASGEGRLGEKAEARVQDESALGMPR